MNMVCEKMFFILLLLAMILYILSLFLLNFELTMNFEYDLLSLNSSIISFLVYIDWVAILFMSFVLFISSMILKYSAEYMLNEKNLTRFIYLMILFVCSMNFMILSPNIVSILLGWDGLGLVSYALVIFYQNVKSYNAGMLTALSNRIGDASILSSIGLLLILGDWNLFLYESFIHNKLLYWFILIAAMTKSAQIPFSSWLPAAMAAPTPVSSLVHSSTLVTAGVYILIRFSHLFTTQILEFLMFFSLLTMFMAGGAANFEYDLKKIVALSTLSQLGMMIFILSLGSFNLAYFHLLIHALFKALLFMCAGAMIHNMANHQDIRYMGGIVNFMPITCVCFNISNFSLCGIPFLSGFYSKDLIAEVFSQSFMGLFIYMVFYLSIGLTVSYSIRLFYYIFVNNFKFMVVHNMSDINNKIMLKGMGGLVFLVILMGSFMSWIMFPSPYFILLSFYMKLMTISMILLGFMMGVMLGSFWYGNLIHSFNFKTFSMFYGLMWNMPILSTFGVNKLFLGVGKFVYKNLDLGWLEYYGSKNLFFILKQSSMFSQLFSKNHLKLYLLMFLIMIIVFIM
uniref:NADH-ubiquinone oxidoreductase chain 5 n=1 Tax=Mecysmoderes ater TaxID=3158840 RepID=A0AAU7GHK9_9CUCU